MTGGCARRWGSRTPAAHPYEGLVAGTIALLERVRGVEEVIHEDREVVLVVTRGVAVEWIGEIVDRYWYEHLPTTPIDPAFGITPADVLPRPWPPKPPRPQGAAPVPEIEAGRPTLRDLRQVAVLPPSRRRMWTYLVCGAGALIGAAVLATTPGGSSGALLLVIGTFNLVVGTRIAMRRRQAA
ncbi:hypothetical protein ACFS33_00080 [Cellulomonas phragmiteti]|uniref:hypothetical protein n=1 Tax=Cellulomonas phragmiteti TaxID=478780 RepID=UPI00362E0B85